MSRLEPIVAACGGILLDAGSRALIPGPGHSQRDRSVSLVETEDGRILVHCFSPKDDWRDVRRALTERGLLDDAQGAPMSDRPSRIIVAQPADEVRIARARKIWDDSRPVRLTPAAAYLRRRAIANACIDSETLRFHPAMTSLDDRSRRPAFIAAIVDAAGALQGVQVTLLTKHGAAKAVVATPRRVIGKLVGGAVRLHAPAPQMLVGEGVETTLSASAALNLPGWALLTAYNLSLFEPPAIVERLVVALDNDAAGHAAVESLKTRCVIKVDFALPSNGANDWNAWAMRR